MFSEHLRLYTLELPKVGKKDDCTELWAWLEFLKAKDREKLEMLAKSHPAVQPAVKKLLRLSESEEAQILHETREKARRDEQARIQNSEEIGWKGGLERGQEEMQLAVARKPLSEGLPLGTVMAITGLSQSEILQPQSTGRIKH